MSSNQAIKQLVLISTIFKTFDSDIDKISSKIGVLGKSFNNIFESRQKWREKIDDLSDPSKGGTLSKSQAKQQVGGLFSYIFKDDSKDKLVEEFEAFKEIMDDTGKTAQEVADNLGDQLNSKIHSYVDANKDGEISTEGFKKSIGNLSIGAKAGQVALKGLALAGNMLVSWGVSLAIDLAIKGIDSLVHAQENAIKAGEEALGRINETRENLKSTKQRSPPRFCIQHKNIGL